MWEGEGRIQYTAGSKRLAAAGISRWRDVARQGGGWLTWKEAQEKYGLKEGADAEAYKEVIRGLGEAEREGEVQKWQEQWKGTEWGAEVCGP